MSDTSKDIIKKIICYVNCKYGAPIGRNDVGIEPTGRVYDRLVPMDNHGYDTGGAYWGFGNYPLRVAFTKDMGFIRFYRGRKKNVKELTKVNEIVKIGKVAVDSGQLMICDPCYIDLEWSKVELHDGAKPNNGLNYHACCVRNDDQKLYKQLNFKLGHAGAGIVFNGGDGDGVYPVFAHVKDGIITKVEIKFT